MKQQRPGHDQEPVGATDWRHTRTLANVVNFDGQPLPNKGQRKRNDGQLAVRLPQGMKDELEAMSSKTGLTSAQLVRLGLVLLFKEMRTEVTA